MKKIFLFIIVIGYHQILLAQKLKGSDSLLPLAQKQVEIARGLFIDPRKGKITLKEWWLEYSNSRQDWAATTRQGNEYRAKAYLLARFPDICLAEMPLQEITPYAVQKWWSNIQRATERKTKEIFNAPKSDTRNARNLQRLLSFGKLRALLPIAS